MHQTGCNEICDAHEEGAVDELIYRKYHASLNLMISFLILKNIWSRPSPQMETIIRHRYRIIHAI